MCAPPHHLISARMFDTGSGVSEYGIDCAEMLARLLQGIADLIALGYIAGHRQRAVPNFARQPV